ncbi:MAG TPA: beta-N-acetylhexosaminidase [Fimbriimonadales bacterium]|nr:beta-N-acetylhexosaminidase [Fimbriimonadales bacterium]
MFFPLLAASAIHPLSIIPMPAHLSVGDGAFTINAQTRIVAEGNARGLGMRLREYLGATGYKLPIATQPHGNAITIRFAKELAQLGEEGYTLTVNPKGVTIAASAPAGAFYGIQTLRQLLPTSIFQSRAKGIAWQIPSVRIEDHPRFSWRGMHLDVCRHFFPKSFIYKYLDLMALHKFNTFHFHLTEDQGWRIEIKKYPKLTDVGAWRKDKDSGATYGGFYTQQDIKDIVAYAANRHITVVPEIEMPGHSQAAIASYPELGNTGKQLPVLALWGVSQDVFNVEDSTIRFLQDVLTEIMRLFPGRFIHIGGDEVPKDQWHNSPRAQERMNALGLKNEDELQSWFIRQMDEFLASRNRRLIGWDEILEGGLAPGAAVMSWRGSAGGYAAAKAGHDVVMAPNTHTYFDYYQSRDRSHEPKAIGGYLPLETVYAFEPVPAGLSAAEAAHILGAQGQLWTEYIAAPEHLEYMAYPRACALAEVVWSPKNEDFADFSRRLQVHLKRLKDLDVNFRPLGGAESKIADGAKAGEPRHSLHELGG